MFAIFGRAKTASTTKRQSRVKWRPCLEVLENRHLLSFAFSDFTSLAGLQLNGDAAKSGTELRLAPQGLGREGAGSAWFTTKQTVEQGFDTTFSFRIAGIADGFAFVIQNSSASALGGTGGDLGYGRALASGIPNSIAIEFDIILNGDDPGEPSDNHISVHTRGTQPNSRFEEFSIGAANLASPNLNDGSVHQGRIKYANGTLQIFVDNLDTPRLSVPTNLGTLLSLDAGKAFVGLTAGVGAQAANHDILSWSFTESVQSDIAVVDATTLDFRRFDIKYEVTGGLVPDFAFRAYLSSDTIVGGGDVLLEPQYDVSAEPVGTDAATTRSYNAVLTLDESASVQDGKRFVLIVADPWTDDNPRGEVVELDDTENNTLFAIPLLPQNVRVFFNQSGRLVMTSAVQESDVVGQIKGRLHDPGSLIDISSLWGPILNGQNDQPTARRAIKNEEVWINPTPAFDGDDAHVAAALSAPLNDYAKLVDSVFDGDRLPPGTGTVWITEAFDREGEHKDTSLHYEGRAIDFGLRGVSTVIRNAALERLAGLAFLAGFDFVWNEGSGVNQHVHVSHRADTPEVTVDSLIAALNFANMQSFVNHPGAYLELSAHLVEIKNLINGRQPTELSPKERKDIRKAIKEFIVQAKQEEKSSGLDQGFGVKGKSNNTDTKVKHGLLTFNADRLLQLFD
jgi:hypothetical protein